MTPHLQLLVDRALPDGGFSEKKEGGYRPDATAWASLALQPHHEWLSLVGRTRTRLISSQRQDGSVCLFPDHPDAIWPTALAILAWNGSSAHQEPLERAIQFLLTTTGHHWTKKDGDTTVAHDPSIPGWPWIANTHSWVEPTAMGVMALRVTGHQGHERVQLATHMIMDRQLPRGGWNYGNIFVFGQELHPAPESTGVVLQALADQVSQHEVDHSLEYLSSKVTKVRTPLALGWSLLGLGAWGLYPAEASLWVEESLNLQKRYGLYDTPSLCLLLIALSATNGLLHWLSKLELEKQSTQTPLAHSKSSQL